jgi:multiple sugar transport system substrate-binding protein
MSVIRKHLVITLALMMVMLPLLVACGGETNTSGTGSTNATATSGTTGNTGGDATATGGTTNSGGTGEKVTLTFWNGFTGPDRPAVEEITNRFNTANPNIQIQMDIQPWDTLIQKLLSTMSTGTGPDIIGVSFGHMPRYAESGYVMDLTPYMEAGTDLDPANWPPALVDLLKYDGKFYAAPMNYATLMMYYNKDMFKAAGLDPHKPPADWNAWIDALKKLSKPEQGQYGMAIGEYQTIPNWPIFIWANGGDVIRDGKSALTDPKTVEALKIWSELVKTNKISPTGLTGAEADKLFQTQKAAMGITGPWMTNGFTEAGINYDVAPIPTGPGGPVTLADTVVMMVNKSTKNPEAAVKFVQHWNSKESQLYFATETGFPPARTDLANDPKLAENKWSPKFASVASVSKFYLGGQVNFAQIDNEVFVPMIQSIVLGKQSVEDATKEADQKLNALLKQP